MSTPTSQAYDEFQRAYDHYNNLLFDGDLPPCLMTMQREKRTYGYFSHKRFIHCDNKESVTDEIALNPSYFGVVPLLEILQTVVHEMCHLWQFHHGNPGRRGYHNVEWANKMEAIGLMPSSTGQPGGKRVGDSMADYAIRGGDFMKATQSLLADGFRVTWFDRFPPEKLAQIATTNENAGETILALFLNDDEDELSEEAAEMYELAAAVPLSSAGIGEMIQPQAGNRSNRDKYRCPECGAQVWGKPGLRVICGGDGCDDAVFIVVGDSNITEEEGDV